MDGLLTTREVGDLLGVHERTVLRMIQRGRFPNAFRVERAWRIPKGDVEKYVEKGRWERQAAASDPKGRS